MRDLGSFSYPLRDTLDRRAAGISFEDTAALSNRRQRHTRSAEGTSAPAVACKRGRTVEGHLASLWMKGAVTDAMAKRAPQLRLAEALAPLGLPDPPPSAIRTPRSVRRKSFRDLMRSGVRPIVFNILVAMLHFAALKYIFLPIGAG